MNYFLQHNETLEMNSRDNFPVDFCRYPSVNALESNKLKIL